MISFISTGFSIRNNNITKFYSDITYVNSEVVLGGMKLLFMVF